MLTGFGVGAFEGCPEYCYPLSVEKSAPYDSESSVPQAPFSFEELAAQQHVAPVSDFESLPGHPSREDESAEDFSAMLRRWRHEGTGAASPNECRDR